MKSQYPQLTDFPAQMLLQIETYSLIEPLATKLIIDPKLSIDFVDLIKKVWGFLIFPQSLGQN